MNLLPRAIARGTSTYKKKYFTVTPDETGVFEYWLDIQNNIEDWKNYKGFHMLMHVDMDAMAIVEISFYKENDNLSNVLTYQIIPGVDVSFCVYFQHLKSDKLFIPTTPGMLKGKCKGLAATIDEMLKVKIKVYSLYAEKFEKVVIKELSLISEEKAMYASGKCLVDEFGQSIEKDWNGKIHCEEELISYLQNEFNRAQTDNKYPENFSRYGGCKEIQFDKTGFFHMVRTKERWWLVDPDGYGFFSNGVCYASRMGVYGHVNGMENLFSWLPKETEFRYHDAWTTADKIPEYAKRNGIEMGKKKAMFNFARANMIRAFGPDKWKEAWIKINAARMKRWGFNTIGIGVNSYDDEDALEYIRRAEIPFVWTLKNFPLTKERIFRDFPDVFSKEYRNKAASYAKEQLTPLLNNTYLIGYFITNEPEWRFQNVNLAEQVFSNHILLESKKALVEKLIEKYGKLDKLNDAWGSHFDTLSELYSPVEHMIEKYPKSEMDMQWLHEKLVEKYETVVCEELHKIDNKHLDLGMRYAYGGAGVMGGCQAHDAFSFNCYEMSPEKQLQTCVEVCDMPMMIGEWHIGATNQGKLAGGLLYSPNQEERGKALVYYAQHAMANPNCIGAHYFEWNDQPFLGRFDGECMGHGLIDVCNRSYDSAIDKIIRTNTMMYSYVTGRKAVASEKAKVRDVLHKVGTY